MEADDEFADFTSAFPSTGQEKKVDGINAFHEIGGSVFEIPPLDFEDDDQFSPTNSMRYPINTSSSGGPLELTLPPPISDSLAVPNGDVPFDPLPDLPPLNGFTFPPLSDELTVPSSVGGTTEQVIATNTIEQVVTENNKNVTVTMETTGTTFANFASFESMETPVTMETTGSDFSGFVAATDNTPVTMPTKNDIGFANFSSPPPESVTNDYFGSFKSPTVPEIDSTSLGDEDDSFGNFSSFSEAIPKTENSSNTLPASSTVKEMTSLHEPTEDDFGDFGSFTVAPPTAIVAPPTSTIAPKSTSLKISLDALINCFPVAVIDNTTTSTVKHLKEYLVSVDRSNKMWTSVKDKAESTSFFYQWNQSFLQDRFFTAVNVDPMLVPANAKSGPPSAGEPLLTLDTLPGGAGNLLEGFGFDTSIKSKAQPQDRGFGWTDEGATLLDLSLPTSPIAPQEQISAVIFGEDLLGVDLTAIDLTAPPPNSIDNVLEGTPTSWMDSELLELEAETQHMPPPSSSTHSYDWLAKLTSVTSSSVNPQGDTSTDLLTATTTNGFDLLTSGNLDNGELDIISSSVTVTTEYTGWSFESAPLVPDTVVMETTTISTSEMPPPSTHEQSVDHLQKSSLLSNKAQNLLDRLPNLYYMTHDSMLYVT